MTSPLTGGRRRRRPGRALALGALMLAGSAAGATAVLEPDLGRAPGGRGAASAVAPTAPDPPRGASLAVGPGALALEGRDTVRVALRKPPRGGVLFDVRSGRVLWRHRPLERLPMASLAKIMTAVVVAERTTRRARPRITRAALNYRGSGVGVLPKGRRVPVDALMHGLLLVSGNDAAIALADHVAGGERRFVRLMNSRARHLGLACTRFVSSHGLEPANRSCAADLAVLARVAMARRRIARVVRKRQAAVRFPIKGGRLYLNSTNPLLRSGYRGTIGLKTGYTRRAGRSLVAVARRGRRTLGVVLLDSPDPARQAKRLLGAGFRSPPAG